MQTTTASAKVDKRVCAILGIAGLLTALGGCGRTAVIVDNPAPNVQTVVTVEHVPQTQPSDKDLVIRNKR